MDEIEAKRKELHQRLKNSKTEIHHAVHIGRIEGFNLGIRMATKKADRKINELIGETSKQYWKGKEDSLVVFHKWLHEIGLDYNNNDWKLLRKMLELERCKCTKEECLTSLKLKLEDYKR